MAISEQRRQIGFVWLCFFAASKHEILHNHLSYKTMRQFRPTANWLCFFKFLFFILTLSAERRTLNANKPVLSIVEVLALFDIELGLFSPSVQSTILHINPCNN